MLAELTQRLAHDHERILDFTRRLVAVPTENPPGRSYRECVQVLTCELDAVGLDYQVIEVPVGPDRSYPRYCVLSSYGSGTRTLYFHGHYDVVPAASRDQFEPVIKGRHLFGRGSSDMKSGLAAMLYAVNALKTAGIELDGRIGLVFVPDEETGGAHGSQYLQDAGLLGRDGIGMLLPEPTSGIVWNANRGAISLRVTVKGRPAHVGQHYKGINAFERMLAVAQRLTELKLEVASRTTRFKITPQAARHSILLLGGQCAGGTNFNVVPDECSFTVDRRINPEEDLAAEKQRLLSAFDRIREDGIDLEVDVFQQASSAGAAEDTPLAQALTKSVAAVTGKAPAFEMCPGLLEIRFYLQQGVPAYAYGPGLLSVSHGPHEFVKVDEIYRCAAVYAMTAARVLLDCRPVGDDHDSHQDPTVAGN